MNEMSVPRPALVFKICSAEEWRAALASGAYAGSADDARDGFIHLSCAHQLAGTLARHFAARADLVLLAVRTADLGPALRFEPSRGGDRFPHLYTALSAASVAWQVPLALGSDGRHGLPADLADLAPHP